MFRDVSYFLIFGKPLILYLGVITLLMFLVTASIPVLSRRGVVKIPFVWHARMAVLSVCFAIIHGMLGIGAYF